MSNFTSDYTFDINPRQRRIHILDDEERRRFAMNDHDYLITQCRLTDKSGVQILPPRGETW